MTTPSDAAIGFEAVKVAMSQTRDGTKIVLVIHPNDVPIDLLAHPLGTRYQVALVAVDDEGEPVAPKSRTDGERAVTSAAMLCRDVAFQKWLYQCHSVPLMNEETAILYVKTYCGIESRAELKTNVQARAKFDELKKQFNERMV